MRRSRRKCRKISVKMKCPYCGFGQDRVVDSRESKEADSIRRRRECERCNRRFTTYERIDEIPYMVVKKDGRRERFDRQKVLSGLLRACEKRPVSSTQLEKIVDATESFPRGRAGARAHHLRGRRTDHAAPQGARHCCVHSLRVGVSRLQGCARVQGRAGRAAGERTGKGKELAVSS